MSAARDQFLGRVGAIGSLLANPVSIDTLPVPVPSSAAVAVRNGCMVMLFCALEAFIRDRSLECATAIDQSMVPYSHLPEGLKYASVVATFEGLLNLTRTSRASDKIVEFEKAAAAAASGSLGAAYQFTSYSFARDKSNISVDDVGEIAKDFGVSGFWSASRAVGQSAGLAMLGNVDDSFRQLAKERHRAAHSASHNVPHSALQAALPQAVFIALTFDTLVSTAAWRLSTSAIAKGIQPNRVSDADVRFITVKPHRAGRWAAFRPTSSRASFVESDRAIAMARATKIGRPGGLSIVCHDAAGRAATWTTVLG